MKNKIIFDVGAYDGIDGLALAIKNPKCAVYAFEANPVLFEKINHNKFKIEKRIGKRVLNYKAINKAVSNVDKQGDFLISKNPTSSSLKEFSKNLDETWPGYREPHFHTVKKINVKIITLEKFCIENNIEFINYLHIDTQGNDLNVFKGLGKFQDKIKEGVLEAAVNKKNALYVDSNTVEDVKIFFENTGYRIKKINPVDSNIKQEVNVYFENKKFIDSYKVNTNYKARYFFRVVSSKTYIKDDIRDFFLRILNFFS